MICHNRKRHDNSYYYRADAPPALPIHCNPPPVMNPAYNPSATVVYPATSTRSGYSGGTVAGAALAGAVGGALFENAVSHHHSGHSSGNDFGGGHVWSYFRWRRWGNGWRFLVFLTIEIGDSTS